MDYKVKEITISTDIVHDMKSDIVSGSIFPEFVKWILSEVSDDAVIILTNGVGEELERSTVKELKVLKRTESDSA